MALHGHLCDASGGLVYHWRALRYRHRLWPPFVLQIAAWLSAWQVPERELVIVGPSAGYTLDLAFLKRFARVTILEPDPLARALLRLRFAGITFESGQVDCFSGLDGLAALSEGYPQAAILFANSIGQQLRRLDPAWVEALPTALAGHSWASYHDVLATRSAPAHTQMRKAVSGEVLEDLLAGFWTGRELEIFDHGSFGKLPASEYAIWSITPGQYHLVGWSSIIVVGSSIVIPGNSGIAGRS